jgi:hypothetical protein
VLGLLHNAQENVVIAGKSQRRRHEMTVVILYIIQSNGCR